MGEYEDVLERIATRRRKERIERHAQSAIIVRPEDPASWVAENVHEDAQHEVMERVVELQAQGFQGRGHRYTEEEREAYMKTKAKPKKGSRTIATKAKREEIRDWLAEQLRKDPKRRRSELLEEMNLYFDVDISEANFAITYLPQAKERATRQPQQERRQGDAEGDKRGTEHASDSGGSGPDPVSVPRNLGSAPPVAPAAAPHTNGRPANDQPSGVISELITSGPVFCIEHAGDGRVRVAIDFEAPPATGFAAFAALAAVLAERGEVQWQTT
jgi:hypothetical protein